MDSLNLQTFSQRSTHSPDYHRVTLATLFLNRPVRSWTIHPLLMQLNSSGSGSMKEGEVLWIWLDRHKLGFLPLTSLVNLMGTSSCAFSHSRNGWWRFESRNNDDLEEAFMGGKQQVKLVIWILWELLDNLYQYLWPCLALYQTYHILKGGDSDLWQHLCDQPGLYGTVSKVNASEEEKVFFKQKCCNENWYLSLLKTNY